MFQHSGFNVTDQCPFDGKEYLNLRNFFWCKVQLAQREIPLDLFGGCNVALPAIANFSASVFKSANESFPASTCFSTSAATSSQSTFFRAFLAMTARRVLRCGGCCPGCITTPAASSSINA